MMTLIVSKSTGPSVCPTWFQGFFQAVIIGPVLWVPLLQTAVHFCCLVQTLQLQQQLSCKNTAVKRRKKEGSSKSPGNVRTDVTRQKTPRLFERDLIRSSRQRPTSCLLHGQLVADLLLVVGQVLQGLLVQPCFPQHLILVKQQLAVLVVHFVGRRLNKQSAVGEIDIFRRTTMDRRLGGLLRLHTSGNSFFSAQPSRHASFWYYTEGTKTGSRPVLSGANQRTGAGTGATGPQRAATGATGPFWQPFVSKFPSNNVAS